MFLFVKNIQVDFEEYDTFLEIFLSAGQMIKNILSIMVYAGNFTHWLLPGLKKHDIQICPCSRIFCELHAPGYFGMDIMHGATVIDN